MSEFDHHERMDDQEARDAVDPNVGEGSISTAPLREPHVPWLQRQPVLAAAILALIPTLTALVAELSSRTTEPLVVIALGGATALITLGAAIVRAQVTPTARPRDDEQHPLVPLDD